MAITTRFTAVGCPVTMAHPASYTATFAAWDVDWEIDNDIVLDTSVVYNITRTASLVIHAKSGTESTGYTYTLTGDASAWVTGDTAFVSLSSTIAVHASWTALLAARGAYDTGIVAYSATTGDWRFAGATAFGTTPIHIKGHLSRQRCTFTVVMTVSGDQSSNTTQLLWRNVSYFVYTGDVLTYNDTGAGKTGGGIKVRRVIAHGLGAGEFFYAQAGAANCCQLEFVATLGITLIYCSFAVKCYHCLAAFDATGYENVSQASTYQNCAAVQCAGAGYTGKTNGTYTKCAELGGATGSEAGLNNLTWANGAFWGQGNNAGFFGIGGADFRILTTSSLYNAGTAVAGLGTDIDGNDISTLVPIGIHKGTTNAYGVSWPTAGQIENAVSVTAFSGTITGTLVGEAHTAAQVIEAGGGTYHEAAVGEVKLGTAFGPASAYTGTLPSGTYYQTSGSPVVQSKTPVVLGATETTIYTCPTGYRAVLRVTLANSDTSARTADLHKVLSGETAGDSTNAIKLNIPLAAKGSDGDDWVDVARTLEAGDKISGLASVASKVVAQIELIEIPVATV